MTSPMSSYIFRLVESAYMEMKIKIYRYNNSRNKTPLRRFEIPATAETGVWVHGEGADQQTTLLVQIPVNS